jgi:hypothetical protein
MTTVAPFEVGEWHGVELEQVPTKVLVWVVETYGPLKQGRWFVKNKTLFFRDPADHAMFLWRWI